MSKSQRDPARESYWRNVLDRQRTSGLNARAFCRREGLAESSFHFWRRTIRQRDAAGRQASPAFVPAVIGALPLAKSPTPAMSPPRRAMDLPAGPAAVGPGITIDLRGGRVMRLPATMPVSRVAELIRALEGDVSIIAGDSAGPSAEVAS